MDETALAQNLEKLLTQIKTGKARVGLDSLVAAASGDRERLASALWRLVREGKGALVGHERAALAMLSHGPYTAADLVSLLGQLNGAGLFWFERWSDRVDGLAYYGWSKELEAMLEALIGKGAEADAFSGLALAEPSGSSLWFALCRRGLSKPEHAPEGALSKFGRAFLWRGSWCPEQFEGIVRVWPAETLARAAFAHVSSVKDVGVYPDTLDPLVGYATPEDLTLLVEKMVWPDRRVIEWLASRADAIVPLLEKSVEELSKTAKQGSWISSRLGPSVGALARIRLRKGLHWKGEWLPLAKAMLRHDTTGLRDVLADLDPAEREAMLHEHLANKDHWRDNLWPLVTFPTSALVQAVARCIHDTPRAEGWDFEREPLFKALGAMGDEGQEALEKMLDEPEQMDGAMANLMPNKARALKCLPLLGSSDVSLAHHAKALWAGLEDSERIALLDEHLSALPPLVAAELLAGVHAHPRTEAIALRLPETEQTRALRRFCLSHPGPLKALMAAMADVPDEALLRAKQALAPLFVGRRVDSFRLDEALKPFGPADLPAILRVTACKMGQRRAEISALCEHFWPACPELPWVAVYWWSFGDTPTLYAAERLMGAPTLAALRARFDTGYLQEEAFIDLIRLFGERDPIESFDLFVQLSEQKNLEGHCVVAIRKALDAGHAPARDFLQKALEGAKRDSVLESLSKEPIPALLPTLQSLEKQKLSAKSARLLKTALASLRATGAGPSRSNRTLAAKALHPMDGPIEALHLSDDGKTLCGYAAGCIKVWKGKREAATENLGQVSTALSLDGKYVLVLQEFSVDVYDVWKSLQEPCTELSPDDGLGLVVPMPGGRAFTLCAAHNAYTPLTLWTLETGKEKVHKIAGFPAHVALLDEERYVIGGMEGAVAVRNLNTGKVLCKLQEASEDVEDGICMVGGGDQGKLVAALFMNGHLMIWDLTGAKPKALGSHENAAPLALATDQGSRWVVTAGEENVLPWKDGLPQKALPGRGGLAQKRSSGFEGAGHALFLKKNVVAVCGQGVDVWNLEKGEHLGAWEKPITAMATAKGKLFVGDESGTIWEISVA